MAVPEYGISRLVVAQGNLVPLHDGLGCLQLVEAGDANFLLSLHVTHCDCDRVFMVHAEKWFAHETGVIAELGWFWQGAAR